MSTNGSNGAGPSLDEQRVRAILREELERIFLPSDGGERRDLGDLAKAIRSEPFAIIAQQITSGAYQRLWDPRQGNLDTLRAFRKREEAAREEEARAQAARQEAEEAERRAKAIRSGGM